MTGVNSMYCKTNPELSLVIPTYNEQENIEYLLRDLGQVLADRSHEIIVVDDDSPDGTWKLVESLRAKVPNVRLERRRGERALAESILAGFRLATGRILGCMDADGSHPTAAIPDLLAMMEQGFDVVVGSRYLQNGSIAGWPVRRQLLSRAGAGFTRRMLHLPIHDPMSGFYLLRREVYERASATANSRGYKILLELLIKGHATSVAEVPIHFQNRRLGKSKLSVKVLYRDAINVIALRKFQKTENVLDRISVF
jgi:dolichol-phosphate mannosyltransferase